MIPDERGSIVNDQDLSRLLTLPAASRILGISPKAIRSAIDRGELEAVQLTTNGWPRVLENAIQEWLDRQRIRAC